MMNKRESDLLPFGAGVESQFPLILDRRKLWSRKRIFSDGNAPPPLNLLSFQCFTGRPPSPRRANVALVRPSFHLLANHSRQRGVVGVPAPDRRMPLFPRRSFFLLVSGPQWTLETRFRSRTGLQLPLSVPLTVVRLLHQVAFRAPPLASFFPITTERCRKRLRRHGVVSPPDERLS